jgi:hypothetical protein
MLFHVYRRAHTDGSCDFITRSAGLRIRLKTREVLSRIATDENVEMFHRNIGLRSGYIQWSLIIHIYNISVSLHTFLMVKNILIRSMFELAVVGGGGGEGAANLAVVKTGSTYNKAQHDMFVHGDSRSWVSNVHALFETSRESALLRIRKRPPKFIW